MKPTSLGPGRISLLATCLWLLLTVPAFAGVQYGDKLSITVYNHPELSTQPTVDATGRVSLPVAGFIQVVNADPAVIAERIRARLAPYIPMAAVDVQVLSQSSSLFISGGPGGVLTYAPGMTLTVAVELALQPPVHSPTSTTAPLTVSGNNLDPFRVAVNLHAVSVIRGGATLGSFDVANLLAHGQGGITLQPGDTIGLEYKPIAVTVTGQVANAGIAHLDPSEPLSNALLQVGGINPTTAGFTLNLERDGQTHVVTATSAAYNSPAHDGDILTIPPAVHVAVTGDVTHPGDVALRGDPSILSALYYAGGPNAVGDLKNVQVVHQGVESRYNLVAITHGESAQPAPALADGDTIYVPANPARIDFRGIFSTLVSAAYWFVPRP